MQEAPVSCASIQLVPVAKSTGHNTRGKSKKKEDIVFSTAKEDEAFEAFISTSHTTSKYTHSHQTLGLKLLAPLYSELV